MSKAPWIKGRRKPSFVVRIENDVYPAIVEEALTCKIKVMELVSSILRIHLEKIGKL